MGLIKIFLILLFVSSCSKDGSPTNVEKSRDNFNVQLLFEKDDCKMYRFYDYNTVYFMTCPNSSTQYTKTCGKNCRKKIEQETK